ncbi:MAG: hypothetical protein GXZ15_06190, partial [Campylobacter sp.]|nr:hypothetical protein [Campylobacter sp.]
HEPLKNELLAYTQKFEHIRDNSDRYLAVATYLNPVLKDTQNEIFLLSSYPKDEPILLETLKLNNDANLSITELEEDDKILELSNINIPWSKHYKIVANFKEADYLTISYSTKKETNVKLKFLKVSKSMYWQPEIKLDN